MWWQLSSTAKTQPLTKLLQQIPHILPHFQNTGVLCKARFLFAERGNWLHLGVRSYLKYCAVLAVVRLLWQIGKGLITESSQYNLKKIVSEHYVCQGHLATHEVNLHMGHLLPILDAFSV